MLHYSKLIFYHQFNRAELPLPLEIAKRSQFKVIISTRTAGEMSFYKREKLAFRDSFFKLNHINKRRVYSAYQIHSKDVIVIKENESPHDFSQIQADGLITCGRIPLLSITVADCLPIFLIDKKSETFGIFHSGWKGTGIILNGLRMMDEVFSIKRENLFAFIGPGIDECCYSVSKERAKEFSDLYGKEVVRIDENKYYLSLKKANINILRKNGIADIHVIDNCTCCDTNLHSYRRDGPVDYSVMIAIIGFF